MRALLAILAVIVLLGAALVITDRVAENFTSGLIAQQLSAQLHLSRQPTVNIAGFPFLTQVASGDYQEVDIAIPSVSALSATVDDITATAREIHARTFLSKASDVRLASARVVDVSGRVPLSSIPLPPGFTASDSHSELRVSGTISVLGHSLPLEATEHVELNGSTVNLHPTNIQAQAGGSKFEVPGSVTRALTLSIDLSGLPFHARLTRLSIDPSGLHVAGRAQHVSLAGT